MQISKWPFRRVVTVCGIAGLVVAGDSASFPQTDMIARGRIVFVGLGIGLAFGLVLAVILRRRTPVST